MTREAPARASTPSITVGLPVRNGERFLEEAIDSVLAQTHDDWELLICDNASDDRTGDIGRHHAARDRRIRYLRQPRNIGAAPNFNTALAQAQGSFFKWLAADDAMEARYLEATLELLRTEPTAVLACSWYRNRSEILGRTFLVDTDHELAMTDPCARVARLMRSLPGGPLLPIWGLMRTDVARQAGGIGSFIGADEVFVLSMALRGRFLQVPDHLLCVRDHWGAYHTYQSKNRGREGAAEAIWLDTAAQARVHLPYWGRIRRYVGAVHDVDLDRRTKLRIDRTVVAAVARQRWERLLSEPLFAVGLGPVYLRATAPFRAPSGPVSVDDEGSHPSLGAE
jgi:glycosyltransferase involved in cell wall biosynthesis